MKCKSSLVITSIAGQDNKVLQKFAQQAEENVINFIVIGDTKSPAGFNLPGCDFYSIERQEATGFSLAEQLPRNHYARKNIGYLLAMQSGSDVIIETDDDNFPYDTFWDKRIKTVPAGLYQNENWINVYKLFTEKNIWPRGFSLEHVQKPVSSQTVLQSCKCPVQQGLADENPDVDAIYRLVETLPVSFEKSDNVALGNNSWCPFNSQNTTWFKEAFPLMYLPSFCSFRMTDIWRSFVVQRICWENDWNILFHNATVWQARNDHNLMRDFSDEIQGYLQNDAIVKGLEKLSLKQGTENTPENLLICYELFIRMNLIDKTEIRLIEAWLKDMSNIK